ncbi:MAG: alpha/beta hydrolase [Myxococcales bacterium]|jgi:pimeloyl-ACP methyl ester carboxylesterase
MTRARHIREDGTEIIHRLEGPADAPALVLTNGLTTDTGFWRYLWPGWARDYRVLMWDLPGHGESGPARTRGSATMEGAAVIIEELMDAAGMGRAVQIGWSTGSQVIFELYRRAPARCAALVSLLGTAGRVLDTATLPLPGPVIDGLSRVMPPALFSASSRALSRASDTRLGHFLGRRLGLLGPDASEPDVRAITRHMRTLHAPTVQIMLRSAQAQSASDLLPRLQVPLLIVSGDRDPFAPAETVATAMQRAAPDAELVRLPHGTHTALLDHATVIDGAVRSFLQRRVA